MLAGTVGPQAAGSTLTVNGHPLSVDASGAFAGSVDLNGSGSIALQLSDPVGGQTVFTIPLTLAGLGGVIPTGVLDSVQQAGVSLLSPLGGDDGSPLTVGGSVLGKKKVAGLTANGMDILGALGSDGSFSVQLPGTTKSVTLTERTPRHDRADRLRRVGYQSLSSGTTAAACALGVRKSRKVRFYKQNVLRRYIMSDGRDLSRIGAACCPKARRSASSRPRNPHRPTHAHQRPQGPGDLHAEAAQGCVRQASDPRHAREDAEGKGHTKRGAGLVPAQRRDQT